MEVQFGPAARVGVGQQDSQRTLADSYVGRQSIAAIFREGSNASSDGVAGRNLGGSEGRRRKFPDTQSGTDE